MDREGGKYRRRRSSDSRERLRPSSPRRRYSRSDSREVDRREGRCFGCGDRGHIRAHCPNSRGGARGVNRYDDRKRDHYRSQQNPEYNDRSGYGLQRRREKSTSRSPPQVRDRRPSRRDYNDRDYSPRISPRGRASPRPYKRNGSPDSRDYN